MLTNPEQFLDLQDDYCKFETSRYVLQQLPYEYTSSYGQGSVAGPAAIIKASAYVELYDEQTQTGAYLQGIATLRPVAFEDRVNEEAMRLITAQTAELLKLNKFIISLGSEHTITYGIVEAFLEKYPQMSLLQIDAHADLREAYYDSRGELSKWSHACVMKRVYDRGVPLVQAGIRALSKPEAALSQASASIHTLYAHQISPFNNDWIGGLIDALPTEHVYVTIDADGLDPSIAPAVGTPEPNGLSFHQATALLEALAKAKTVVGFDVVECCPLKHSSITEYTLAKLIYRFLNLLYNKS